MWLIALSVYPFFFFNVSLFIYSFLAVLVFVAVWWQGGSCSSLRSVGSRAYGFQ